MLPRICPCCHVAVGTSLVHRRNVNVNENICEGELNENICIIVTRHYKVYIMQELLMQRHFKTEM